MHCPKPQNLINSTLVVTKGSPVEGRNPVESTEPDRSCAPNNLTANLPASDCSCGNLRIREESSPLRLERISHARITNLIAVQGHKSSTLRSDKGVGN